MTLAQILHVEDLFHHLGKEDESHERRIEVASDPRLEAIVSKYRAFVASSVKIAKSGHEGLWLDSGKFTPLISTAEDVEKFCLALANFQIVEGFEHSDWLSGIYLSRLIKESPERVFNLYTNHLEVPPSCLGYGNEGKKITVHGDVNSFTGGRMLRGFIEVNGNSIYSTGYCMQGGELIIRGDTVWAVGCQMTGGEIRVYGNAGQDVGFGMRGGILRIEGTFEGLGISKGGDIYHRGRRIVKDGRILT